MAELSNKPGPRVKLTYEQLASIHYASRASKKIVADYPEIAHDYRTGLTHERIVEKYDFREVYAMSQATAMTAVYYALHELISITELATLEHTHHSQSGQRIGPKTYNEGIALFSASLERKLENARKGVVARGLTPWSQEERLYFIELCQNPVYHHKPGSHGGEPNYNQISQELYAKFGTRRVPKTLRCWRKILADRKLARQRV